MDIASPDPPFSISRRDVLKAGVAVALPFGHTAFAAIPLKAKIARASIGAPVAAIYGKDDVAWAITKGGQLWERLNGAWRAASDVGALDPDAPLAYAHGRLCARSDAGALWVRERGSAKGLESPNAKIAPFTSFAPLAFAVIGVARGENKQSFAVRLEGSGNSWREVARSSEPVLPDARPIQVDLDGALANADDGQIAVLAGPDDQRYRHGVLGDAVEATRILYLERHSLRPIRTLSLPAPYVFEDVALRPIKWMQGATERTGLLTMRSAEQGAQLCVVAASVSDAKALEIAALGAPIGTANRWMSASTDGERIVAVHTPHIGGIFHAYGRAGEVVHQGARSSLIAKRLHSDVSTHAIHSRIFDLTVWLHDRLIMPSQNYRRLHVFEKSDAYTSLGTIELPDAIVATAAMPGAVALKKIEVLALTRQGELLEISA
jgi:hypothetical protein